MPGKRTLDASPSRRTLALVFAAIMVTSVVAIPVAGQGWARGEPDISVHLPDNEVTPGSDTQLTFQLQNNGNLEAGTNRDAVTTARAVSVEVRDPGPFDVRSGSTAVGTIPDGSQASVNQRFVVPDDVEPGEYTVRLRLRYSYTAQTSSEFRNERTVRRTIDATVRVVDEARFAISDVETDVQPGTTGDAELTVENVGSATARDVRSTVQGLGGVTIGSGAAESYLGTMEPGTNRTITVEAAVAESVRSGETPIEATFQYRDENGIDKASGPITGSLTPIATQEISIENLADTLSVGYGGQITGTVRNDGPRTISDGVLVIEPRSDSLFVDERRFALPELAPNETADFTFPTDVSGQADPGPRQVQFTVEYSNDGRQIAEVGPTSERVTVDPRQPEFDVGGIETGVSSGGSTTMTLEITNQRPETLSNINAKLYTDSPLSAASDEAFVNELEPGDSAEIVFSLSAADGAMAKTYPVELDFQYDTERGDTVLSRTYQHPIEVTEPIEEEREIPFLVIGLVLLVVLGVGAYWYRTR